MLITIMSYVYFSRAGANTLHQPRLHERKKNQRSFYTLMNACDLKHSVAQ